MHEEVVMADASFAIERRQAAWIACRALCMSLLQLLILLWKLLLIQLPVGFALAEDCTTIATTMSIVSNLDIDPTLPIAAHSVAFELLVQFTAFC